MMVIDDSNVNWIIGSCAVGIPAIGTTLYIGWKRLIAFVSPKITSAFTAHMDLVDELKAQTPIINTTLRQIAETQDRQCDLIEENRDLLQSMMESQRHTT